MPYVIGGRPLVAYVLTVAPHRRGPLLHAWRNGPRGVSEAVPTFSVGDRPVIVFVSLVEGAITHVAEGRRGTPAATGSVRLHLRGLAELTRPLGFGEFVDPLAPRLRGHLQRALREGGTLPPATGEALVDHMIEADEVVREHLLLRQEDAERFRDFRSSAIQNLGFQKDAVNVALRSAGIETHDLLDWHLVGHSHRRFFLEGLWEARALEDDMVQRDFSNLPDFRRLVTKKPAAVAHFTGKRNPSNRMTIIMASDRPLERQTGVDLIYLNERYRSFTMVQYKAMEREGGKYRFRWQDGGQLDREIQRMKAVWSDIKDEADDDDPHAFRFSRNPFFLKFCRREPFRPDTSGMSKGLYLPLPLWERLYRSGRLTGPRGGNVLTYGQAGRWLSNTEFINLLVRSWVGTSADQTSILESFIERLIADGKAIVCATKHAPQHPSQNPLSR